MFFYSRLSLISFGLKSVGTPKSTSTLFKNISWGGDKSSPVSTPDSESSCFLNFFDFKLAFFVYKNVITLVKVAVGYSYFSYGLKSTIGYY